MLTTVLVKLGLAIFAALPVERVLAMLLNKWLDKIDAGNIDKARKTAEHLGELAALFNDILADKQISASEATAVRDAVVRAREKLLAAWAAGASAKSTQAEIGKTGVESAYVEPLLKGAGCVILCCLMFGAAGCLTRTRCQQIEADTVNITVNCNDPDTLAENAYPRTLNLLSQDQQVEGGADSIASGNKTDPSLQVPMGDSALGYLGQLLGGLFKGTSSNATAKATPGVAAAGGADCSDGSCSVQ